MSTKKYAALIRQENGVIAVCRAERVGNVWMIGGDYDYRGVEGLWNLTDKKAYKFCNGRLKFQDWLTEQQCATVLNELKTA